MKDEKPLTKSELIAVLEEVGVATKKDVEKAVFQTVTEATMAITDGMDGIIKDLRAEIKASADSTGSRLKRIEIELHGLKDDIGGLHAELSDKASRKELSQLRARMIKYHPLS